MKRVLVTGHRGFIGQNISGFLCRYGIEPFGLEKHDKYTPDKLQGMDAVIHLGAISSTTETDWNKLKATNIEFPQQLFEDCLERGILFQYASSASVYGDSKETPENNKYIPKSLYARSKYMFDQWIQLKHSHGYQGFRYFNCYGDLEEHKGDQASPISKFRWQAKQKGEVEIFKNSKNYLRDFISVSDVFEVHLFFLRHPEFVGIWNVGTGNPISFKEVAKLITQKYGGEIKEVEMPLPIHQPYTADLTRLHEHFPDFTPKSVAKWLKYKHN